jgi:hypothetical protein
MRALSIQVQPARSEGLDTQAAALWDLLRSRFYDDSEFGPHMRKASMALCSSDEGWDDYVILYHFDPLVKVSSD